MSYLLELYFLIVCVDSNIFKAKLDALVCALGDQITCKFFPRLHEYVTLGNVPGKSSSYKDYILVGQLLLMNGVCHADQKFCYLLADPEFALHNIRLLIEQPLQQRNIYNMIPIWHMMCHALNCLMSSLPFQMLILIPLHVAEAYNPATFNSKLVSKIKTTLEKSKDSTLISSTSSKLLARLLDINKDQEEDEENEAEVEESKDDEDDIHLDHGKNI